MTEDDGDINDSTAEPSQKKCLCYYFLFGSVPGQDGLEIDIVKISAQIPKDIANPLFNERFLKDRPDGTTFYGYATTILTEGDEATKWFVDFIKIVVDDDKIKRPFSHIVKLIADFSCGIGKRLALRDFFGGVTRESDTISSGDSGEKLTNDNTDDENGDKGPNDGSPPPSSFGAN